MSDDNAKFDIEPERYELFVGPAYNFALDRRDFIKTFGVGIVFVICAKNALPQESGRGGFRALPKNVDAWIHLGEDGSITALTGKVEVGQNARTSLIQAVADELNIPMSSIRIIMGDTDLVPFDLGTFGSRTTPTMAPQLRKAAAAVREAIFGIAADRLKVSSADLQLIDREFVTKDKSKRLSLAEVAKGQKLVKVIPDNIFIKQPASWTITGKTALKVNARDFVTGRHRYVSDLNREGMLIGTIVRPPAFNSKIISVNDKKAAAIPGVKIVVEGDFIGVVAPDQVIAKKAAESVEVRWETPAQISNAELFEALRKPPSGRAEDGEGGERGGGSRPQGSIENGLAAADKKLSQTYTVDYIAHAPLEPRAAVAEWTGDKLTVWTGTQRPFGVRTELAEAFKIDESRIRVIVPDTGSAYGGKHSGEQAIEAARLARAVGKPVKLVWSRTEEFSWAYFRPAGVIDVKSGVKNDGTITAWEFHNYNSGSSGIQTKYDIPNTLIRFHPSDSPLRQGSYRGLAATANHFARECHIDELADAVGIDPLEFRLKNTKDQRLKDVLQAAANKFGWTKSKPGSGRGFGIAGGFEKNGYIATCVEVAIEPTSDKSRAEIRIVRIVEAFDCGAVVNPLQLKSQIEGAIVQAIGGAVFESIQFKNGKILNPRFATYRVPRFADVPPIEVVLVDRKDVPSAGAGETPIVGLAPAISNAVFNAIGVRLRSLPLAPNGIALPSNSRP